MKSVTTCMALIPFAAGMLMASPASAATTISSAYTRTSGPENIIASFTAPYGATSTRNYTGSVEVLVSGIGQSLGSNFNDAFGPFGTGYYSLGAGTSAQPFGPSNPYLSVARFMSFIEGVGAVAHGTAPAYSSSHSYRFVINLAALNTPLTFGVMDGVFSDNSGAFDITLYQLRAGGGNGGVPEPATWAMLIAGFGLVGGAMRRRTKVAVTYA